MRYRSSCFQLHFPRNQSRVTLDCSGILRIFRLHKGDIVVVSDAHKRLRIADDSRHRSVAGLKSKSWIPMPKFWHFGFGRQWRLLQTEQQCKETRYFQFLNYKHIFNKKTLTSVDKLISLSWFALFFNIYDLNSFHCFR